MNPKKPLDAMEAALHEQVQKTRERVESLTATFEDLVGYAAGNPPDDEHDPEGATIGWERAQVIAQREQAQVHLHELEAALRRLANGNYGRCERCGQSIGEARLIARPATTRCVSCAPSRGSQLRGS